MKLFNIIYVFFYGRRLEGKENAAHTFLSVIQGLVISSIVIKILCIFFSVCYFNDKYKSYLTAFSLITTGLIGFFNGEYYSYSKIELIQEEWNRRSSIKNYMIVAFFFLSLFIYCFSLVLF
jgi:hypothetical protein